MGLPRSARIERQPGPEVIIDEELERDCYKDILPSETSFVFDFGAG